VRVLCYLDRTGGFNVLQVFTLGDAVGWRDVPIHGGSCRVDAGLISIGGIMRWVTRDMECVEEERSGGGACSRARCSGGGTCSPAHNVTK
jgi:hypothetical protein